VSLTWTSLRTPNCRLVSSRARGVQEEWLAKLDAKIEEQTRPFVDELERLDAVPGVDRRVVQVWLAEVGADMSPFPHDENLASWAGACPGNDVSAGKRKRRRFTPGNPWLKQALVQAAWGARRTKNSYLAAQYRRLAGRRSKKRALTAVGRSTLVIFYHLLKGGVSLHRPRRRLFRPSGAGAPETLFCQPPRKARRQCHTRKSRAA